MERNVNFAYIGGLFLIVIVAMIGFIFWMGGGSLDQSKYKSYIVYSGSGLPGVGIGTTIRYKGILVGKVQKIGFKDGDTNFIKLDLLIDSKIKLLQNACVSTESQGLAGATFLDVIQGKGGEIPEGGELCFQKGFMGKLFENIEQSGGDVREIITEVKEIFADENGKSIQEIVSALKVVVQNLEQTRKNIDTLSITANQAITNINLSLQRGDYNIRSIVAPALLGVENSLNEINRFFSKANFLLDRLEKSPYEAIFGQREQGGNKK